MTSAVESATEIRPFQVDVAERSDRSSPPCRSDAVAQRGAGRRPLSGGAIGGDSGSRALLGGGVPLAQGRAKLNALPQFTTEIDGVDIHFIHVRSEHEDALPLS